MQNPLMKPLVKDDLDTACLQGCGEPGCTHSTHTFYFHSRCHPSAGVDVAYTHNTGLLHMTCRECKRDVVRVAVGGAL